MNARILSCLLLAILFVSPALAQVAPDPGLLPAEIGQLADAQPTWNLQAMAFQACVGGFAGPYPCNNVDLLSFLPHSSIGNSGGTGNDIWGWTDPLSGREYVVAGVSTGTSFIDITDPVNPIYLGKLPTHSVNSLWRGLKVYANHAFIISEASGHGMQVFDLTRLRNVVSPPVTFTEDAHYNQLGRAHDMVLNEQSGFGYAVGSREGTQQCGSGLHMIDLHNPTAPVFAGCFAIDGYTHDAQCVIYAGPDTEHVGREICFASNEDTLTVVDVTDKENPAQLSRTGYTGNGYTHQGWLTEDSRYFLVDDELDETNFGHNTRTWIWDLVDLDLPQVIGSFFSTSTAIDHNQFIRGNFDFQANYRAGLRVLSLENVASASLSQVGFFDIYPANDSANFNGAWSVYPFFPSGTVVVNGIEQGVFVLRPNLCSAPPAPTSLTATANGDNRVDLSWNAPGAPPGTEFRVDRAYGSCGTGAFLPIAEGLTATNYSDAAASGGLANSYRVVAKSALPGCSSPPTSCVQATPSGACTAPPAFGGVETVINPGSSSCALNLSWSAASSRCAAGATYNVYRSTTFGFTPSAENRIATGVVGSSYSDVAVADGVTYTYIVRAVDTGNGAEDANLVERSATPSGPPGSGTWEAGAEIGDPGFGATSDLRNHVGWHPDSEHVFGGLRSYVSHVTPLQCSSLTSEPITLLPGVGLPLLTFWSHQELEENDGGVLQISSDGGESWTVLALSGFEAPTYLGAGENGCGFDAGTPAVVGVSDEDVWTRYSANLAPWAGQTVLLRFVLTSDAVGETEGWFLDDIHVTQALVPLACTTAAIFTDGFETGDTSAWSLVVNN